MPKAKTVTKKIPAHKAEVAERAFWEKAESSEYIDWSHAQRMRLPSLKPSTTIISLRLPDAMLDALKILANARDVPYQSLLKVFLAERLAAERGGKRRAS